nr:hypothetical protein [Moritella viscosa]SHO14568.1 Putative uncharacterized protein [Moritella viscosa]
MENELKILKIILKADLSKAEIKTVIYLLNAKEKTIKIPNSEMALALSFTTSNFLRILKKLEENQVVGRRKDGIFVKSLNSWKDKK